MKNCIKIIILLVTLIGYGQEKKNGVSKMQEFASKTGVIIKLEDYNLQSIKLTFSSVAPSKIRKIIAGDEIQYFLQISKTGKYDTKTASIAYDDIVEVQQAIQTLKLQSEVDITTTADYLENKFITEDGFKIGYYAGKGKVKWYAVLEKYGSDNTIFVKNYEDLELVFQSGKEKIEELKNN
ncbi:hypothetical protein BTO05_00510 [Winogradskyella sp. PC-19]|uniref:hypothetical protein n=1 Tax=Winogradskyella sp. PC-19 TaxID=754417 RepID=UPI000B3D273A|nr:hypothetical protein [Winogradskyella sp. PC-19]ARV08192.1 hypothetical protein BTO05_00510 [Winogradskyella sp. PC-19]